METVTWNKQNRTYEYLYSSDEEPRSARQGIYYKIENDEKYLLKTSGTLEEIILAKAKNCISDFVWLLCQSKKIRHTRDGIILATGIRTSHANKSAFHEAISFYGDEKSTTSPNTYYYNVPKHLRINGHSAILAIKRGPFLKKYDGDKLIDTKPWFMEEVIFTGSAYDCIIHYTLIKLEDFLSNVVTPALITATGSISNTIDILNTVEEKEKLKAMTKELYFDLSETYYHERQLEEAYENYDGCGWQELGEEEERNMDEETDGFWRWNID